MNDDLLFKYQVRLTTPTGGYEYFYFYANTNIEKFLNKNNIKYTRNMIHPFIKPFLEEKKVPKIIPEALFEDYTRGAKIYQLYKTVSEIINYLESKEKGE